MLAVILGMLMEFACLPLDDLSSYSSARELPSRAVGRIEPLDAAADVGNGGANDADAPRDAGSALGPRPDAGGAGPALDAGGGSALDGGGALDGGALPPDAAASGAEL